MVKLIIQSLLFIVIPFELPAQNQPQSCLELQVYNPISDSVNQIMWMDCNNPLKFVILTLPLNLNSKLLEEPTNQGLRKTKLT